MYYVPKPIISITEIKIRRDDKSKFNKFDTRSLFQSSRIPHISTATEMMSQFYILGNSVKSIVLVILVILKTNLVILDLFLHSDFMGQSKHRYSFAILSIPQR